MLATSQMLYETWFKLVEEHPDEVALRHPELPNGWTFSEMDRRAREIPLPTFPLSELGFITAHGDTLDFFPTILAAWKNSIPVLILESSHTKPRLIRSEIPDGTALIKQTCGAPGVERSLFFGESQVLAEGQRNCLALGLNPDCRGIAAISLAHSYGFGCLALPLLLMGVPVDALTSPLPVFVQEALDQEGDFFLPGVPALWKTWWLTKTLHGRSLKLKLALSAGAPLSLDLEIKIWNDTGIKLHNFYGTTETGAVAFDDSHTPRSNAQIIGKILPGVDIELSADQRILVQTDARTIGSDLLLSENEFANTHYQTMDEGNVLDGHLHWHDHVGKAINVAGRKVSPEKIKRICLSLPGVSNVIVSGIRSRDYERFEEVKVSLTLDPSHDLKALKETVYNRLDSWEVPRHWDVRP